MFNHSILYFITEKKRRTHTQKKDKSGTNIIIIKHQNYNN